MCHPEWEKCGYQFWDVVGIRLDSRKPYRRYRLWDGRFSARTGTKRTGNSRRLPKKGGLLGISGVSNDMRYVIEAADNGNIRARLAMEVFVTGIVHYIGAFYLDLGRLDDLVFTAGIGEHSARIRRMVCEKLMPIGVRMDEKKNEDCHGEGVISTANSAVCVRVIPTNEELGIARRTYEIQ